MCHAALWFLKSQINDFSDIAYCVCGIDCQRRQWLSEAIDSLQGSQPIRVMLEDVQVILTAGDDEGAVERKQEALEDLQLHTEDLDLANGYLLNTLT